MKKSSLYSLIILGAICFLTLLPIKSFAASNGWVSSGGDNTPESVGATWNIGNRPVYYCIIRDSNFSISENKLRDIIEQSVSTWHQYYINHFKLLSSQNNGPDFNFIYQKSCDPQIDIKFNFGLNTPDVQIVKQKFYEPFAFSTLTSYDVKNGRGKGFLWFADPAKVYPDADPIGLNAMVLHELGHVFGNGHVLNTIMDEKISESIINTGPKAGWAIGDPQVKNFLTNIDGRNKLLFIPAEKFIFDGHVPFNFYNPTFKALQVNLLNRLFGRTIVGNVTAKFENRPTPTILMNYFITLTDSIGSVMVKIQGTTTGTGVASRAEIFKTASNPNGSQGDLPGMVLINKAWTMFSYLQTPDGEKVNLILSLYTDDYFPIQINAIYQNQFIELFKNGTAPAPGTGTR